MTDPFRPATRTHFNDWITVSLPIQQAIDHLEMARSEIHRSTERITEDLRQSGYDVAEALDGLDTTVADRCRVPWSMACTYAKNALTEHGEEAEREIDRAIAALRELL